MPCGGPACDGLKWKDGTNRITAHTDESLMTLLFTSPSEPLPFCLFSDASCKFARYALQLKMYSEQQIMPL